MNDSDNTAKSNSWSDSMDRRAHEQTWIGFLVLVKWVCVGTVVLLAAMAITLT